jgi:hypothetical protein
MNKKIVEKRRMERRKEEGWGMKRAKKNASFNLFSLSPLLSLSFFIVYHFFVYL